MALTVAGLSSKLPNKILDKKWLVLMVANMDTYPENRKLPQYGKYAMNLNALASDKVLSKKYILTRAFWCWDFVAHYKYGVLLARRLF